MDEIGVYCSYLYRQIGVRVAAWSTILSEARLWSLQEEGAVSISKTSRVRAGYALKRQSSEH